jgi:hypothetical protein
MICRPYAPSAHCCAMRYQSQTGARPAGLTMRPSG